MDITEVPEKLREGDETKYLLTLIDTFLKYDIEYILKNKKSETVLANFTNFINTNGKYAKLHTDNGKEFVNQLLINYYNKSGIIMIHGRPYHPQSQGCIESFNKGIKKILETLYLENNKNFILSSMLLDVLYIYNNNKHSSTKFKPIELFYTIDENI